LSLFALWLYSSANISIWYRTTQQKPFLLVYGRQPSWGFSILLTAKEINMENLDIILLTTVLSTLFLVFIIAIYREVRNVNHESYKIQKDGGPRADMIRFIGRLFDDEQSSQKMTYKQKDLIYKAMNRTIADMESEGVYFPEDVKEELKRQREEMLCEYSGLPSVKAYEKSNHI